MNAHQTHTSFSHVSPFSGAGFAHPASNIAAFGIEPGMMVADFGAGSGAYVLPIAKILKSAGRVYAIDVQKDLLRRIHTEAHQRGLDGPIEFIWGDLEAVGGSKIASGKLDLVLISNLLFQVPDKSAVLCEARRILKPSGRLIVIDWSESFAGMGPQREDVVNKSAALTLLRAEGYELMREFHAGAHHYGLILRLVPLKKDTILQRSYKNS